MKKKKLYLDFDSVIADSVSAYCKCYSEIYGQAIGFKEPDPNKVTQWNFQDQAPLEKDPLHIFGMGHFFYVLEFMPDALEGIEKLSEKYDITVCSIGTYDNLHFKSEWLNMYLPFVNAHLIKNDNVTMNKSDVKMRGAIFIDDRKDNLDSSDAKTKICFGKKYTWNEKWDGIWMNTWKDVEKELLA